MTDLPRGRHSRDPEDAAPEQSVEQASSRFGRGRHGAPVADDDVSFWDRPHPRHGAVPAEEDLAAPVDEQVDEPVAARVADPVSGPLSAARTSARRMFLPAAEKLARATHRVRVRRALLLILMTLVLPGSAQVLAGRKAVGRAALRVLVLLVVGAVVVWWRLGRNGVVKWSLHPEVLSTVQVTIAVLGVCWVALLLDAWRLGRPQAQRAGGRLLCGGLVLALIGGVGTPLTYGMQLAGAQKSEMPEHGGLGRPLGSILGDPNCIRWA